MRNFRILRLIPGLVCLAPAACGTRRPPEPAAELSPVRSHEAISLLGDTLVELPLAPATRARYERQLDEARLAYGRAPTDADSILWLGRRLAYLGLFREAIETFTRGFALHPTDARFLRHRGHRYISVREPDRAIADLELAAKLTAGKPDEIEPDGQPNARNIPIGTLQSNIDYHLGLALYLKGDYERAVPVYRRELAAARNDDRRVSIAHWLYLSLRRLGRHDEAAAMLASIPSSLTVIENEGYRRLLLLYKGELAPDALLPPGPSGEMSVSDASVAYGVGAWHLANGREDEGRRILQRIVAGGQWGAFGYIAAEADLARRR